MDDDIQVQAPDAPEPAVQEAPAPETEGASPVSDAEQQPEAPPPYDWRKALDEAPDDEIRRHRKFAGIVGSEKQRWQQEYEASRQAQAEAEANERAKEELRQLYQSNPLAFADKVFGEMEQTEAQKRLNALEVNARKTLAERIGAGMHQIPEWAEVATDPDAMAELATALQGAPDDEVLPRWNATATRLLARRIASNLVEQRIAERIKTERAAWETEAAARGLIVSDRPDLHRAGRVADADPEPPFSDPVRWRQWYARTTGVRL